MYEHNAFGYRSGLALCLTKVTSSRARCPATALIFVMQCIGRGYFGSEREKIALSTKIGEIFLSFS